MIHDEGMCSKNFHLYFQQAFERSRLVHMTHCVTFTLIHCSFWFKRLLLFYLRLQDMKIQEMKPHLKNS